jgi:hypothetical protein
VVDFKEIFDATKTTALGVGVMENVGEHGLDAGLVSLSSTSATFESESSLSLSLMSKKDLEATNLT